MSWYRVVSRRTPIETAGTPANVLVVNGRIAVCTFMPSVVGDLWVKFRSQFDDEFAVEELPDETDAKP